MKFSRYFKLDKEQAELDFVNVDAKKDTRLFVDPFAISIKDDSWSEECGNSIRSFFSEVLAALREDRGIRLTNLMAHLSEPQETFLGFSKGRPQGRGVGSFQAGQIVRALRNSQAYRTGLLEDLADAELFIEGIGPDKISDLTTNVIRGSLIRYTQSQCDLHGIDNLRNVSVGPTWNNQTAQWEAGYHDLPVMDKKPIILVPKYSVRMRMSLNSQEFYNHHMIEYLKNEHLSSNSSLVHVLKNGQRRVYKSEVKKKNPFAKDHLAKFVSEHPEVLQTYKKLMGARGAPDDEDLVEGFNEVDFAKSLIDQLEKIQSGMKDATSYHRFITGVLTFFFYPDLIEPTKEKEINEGRKRIDITFTNASQQGFFHMMLSSPQTRSMKVMIECKNYEKELKNPELDQMSGRFSPRRGFFGILICRKVDDSEKILKSCRDCASDQRGFMIVLDDTDVKEMLNCIIKRNRSGIDRLLHRKFDALTS